MTRYYLFETNAGRGILATDGKKMYNTKIDENGCDQFGVDIYSDNAVEELEKVYFLNWLYTMEEIENEFGGVVDFNESEYENLYLIAEVCY